jgi:hypothetical protein
MGGAVYFAELGDILKELKGTLEVSLKQGTVASDAFGRLRVSEPVTIFDSKQLHSKKSLLWDEVTNGTGTSTFVEADAEVEMEVSANNDYVIRQTKRRFNYQPGKSQLIFVTFVIGNATDTLRRVGYYSTLTTGTYQPNNGIFLEADGSNISLNVIKNNNTVNQEAIAQVDWNVDPMDGTGVSGVTLDFTKTQIMFIDMEWLGVGTVRTGFVVNGKIYVAHIFNHANDTTEVYMQTPNLPLTYEIRSTGGTGKLQHICSTVMSEGGTQRTGISYAVDRGTNVLNVNNTSPFVFMGVAIRHKAGFEDITIDIDDISILVPTSGDLKWSLILNPTYGSTPTWTDLANTSIQYAVDDGIGVTGGTILKSGYISTDIDAISALINSVIKLGISIDGTRDTIALCFHRISTNEDVLCSLNITEQL